MSFEDFLRVFRDSKVCGVQGVWVGFNFGFRPDKNDPKCKKGFDFDTFSKKMLKTAGQLKVGQNVAKCKKGVCA